MARFGRSASALAGLAICLPVVGCGSVGGLYVHEDKVQQAAESAENSWKAALPTSFVDQQKAFLKKLAADEVATAKIEIAAQRDLQLIQLINNPFDSNVRTNLLARLTKLSGGANYKKLGALDQKIADDRISIDNDTVQLAALILELKNDGFTGKLPTCDNTQAPPNVTDNQAVDFQSIATTCKSLTDKNAQLTQDIVDGYAATPGNPTGDLADTVKKLNSLTSDLANQQAQAAKLAAIINAKKKEIDAAKTSPLDSQAAAALKFCLADPSVSPQKSAASQANGASLGDDIKTCEVSAAQGVDALVKQLKHSELRDEIQSVVSTMLNAEASSASGGGIVPKPAIAASTTAALTTLDSLAAAADALSKNAQPNVNELLVALAYEQYQTDLNANEVAALNQRISIFQAKREAVVAEISYIARALEAFDNKSAGEVRAYVNSSWNVGAYRSVVADYADDDLTRAQSLQTSSTILVGWQNMLQPAFDELVAYGKGGLEAQTISNLIVAVVNAGGFAAVAKGVNK